MTGVLQVIALAVKEQTLNNHGWEAHDGFASRLLFQSILHYILYCAKHFHSSNPFTLWHYMF